MLDNPHVFASDLNNRVERENMDNYIVKHLENIKRNNVKVISLPNKECRACDMPLSTKISRQMTFLLRNSQFSQKKVFNLHTIKINNVSQWIENSIA